MTFAAQRKLEREKTEWQVVPQLGKREGRRRRKRMPRVRKAREVERAEGSLVSGGQLGYLTAVIDVKEIEGRLTELS